MIRPGPNNSITDVAGLLVGHAEDETARTGVTVVISAEGTPFDAAADVRGGAPGTVNTAALVPGGLITQLHGVTLAGGSIFGLDAAGGLVSWLARHDRGFKGWGPTIPLVAGAILFDLLNGGDKNWGDLPPYRRLAELAAGRAGVEVAQGNRGAGLGAQAGTLQGGLGTASAFDELTGITVGALAAVNSVGSVAMPGSPTFWAWHLEQADELGGQPPPTRGTGHVFETKRRLGMEELPPNTTIGVVATDAAVDRSALMRLAVHAQDGLALAIRPIHTLFDGDTVFALGTGRVAPPARDDYLIRLGAIAADVMARAVMRGVYEADDLGGVPGYRSLHGPSLRGAGSTPQPAIDGQSRDR